MKKLNLFASREGELELLTKCIIDMSSGCEPVRILEAGCGRRWTLDLSGVNYTLTGIDVDEQALRLRRDNIGDLDETILGDLRDVPIADGSYDVIYSSFVLEHVDGAMNVLNNFVRWLKPGGILILRIPDRESVYGFITRITPHSFHVWYKRHVLAMAGAGTPGHGPYPVFYDEVVSRKGVARFCRANGIDMLWEYGHPFYIRGKRLGTLATSSVMLLISTCSLGRLAWRHNNVTFVLRKRPSSA